MTEVLVLLSDRFYFKQTGSIKIKLGIKKSLSQ